jgi:hypothetical protein
LAGAGSFAAMNDLISGYISWSKREPLNTP